MSSVQKGTDTAKQGEEMIWIGVDRQGLDATSVVMAGQGDEQKRDDMSRNCLAMSGNAMEWKGEARRTVKRRKGEVKKCEAKKGYAMEYIPDNYDRFTQHDAVGSMSMRKRHALNYQIYEEGKYETLRTDRSVSGTGRDGGRGDFRPADDQ